MIQGGEAPHPYPAPSLPQETLWECGAIGDHRGLCHPHASGCTFWEQKWWGRAGGGGDRDGGREHGGGVCVAVSVNIRGCLPICVWAPGFWIPAACPSQSPCPRVFIPGPPLSSLSPCCSGEARGPTSCLGKGVGVTQELLAAWGWRTVQNSDLLSHWVYWN